MSWGAECGNWNIRMVNRMAKCTECKHACHDWTNKDNTTDLYCGNEYSDYFGYNITLMDGCEEGETNEQ